MIHSQWKYSGMELLLLIDEKNLVFDRKSLFQKYPGTHLLQHTQNYILEPESSLHQESRT